MSNRFALLLRLKFASVEEHYGLGCTFLCCAVGEVLGLQPFQHQGCGMFSEGTHCLLAAKRVTTAATIVHPTSVARTKVKALKHSVVVAM